jgi:hypothetical protein
MRIPSDKRNAQKLKKEPEMYAGRPKRRYQSRPLSNPFPKYPFAVVCRRVVDIGSAGDPFTLPHQKLPRVIGPALPCICPNWTLHPLAQAEQKSVGLFTFRRARIPGRHLRCIPCSSSLRSHRTRRSCSCTCLCSMHRRSSRRGVGWGRFRHCWPRCSNRDCSSTSCMCSRTLLL